MANKTHDDKRAAILVDAIYEGQNVAAKKHGVTTRSIRNWQSEIGNDPHFSDVFQKKLLEKDQAWAQEIPAALSACINFIKEATQTASKSNPEVIQSITSAMQTLSEIDLTRGIINARLSGQNRENNQETG